MAIALQTSAVLSIALFGALTAAAAAIWRHDEAKVVQAGVWAAVVAGAVGPAGLLMATGWDRGVFGLADALWVSVAATAVVFVIGALIAAPVRRLLVLVASYLAIAAGLATLAVLWAEPAIKVGPRGIGPWLVSHIILTLATYGALTVAALAGLAAVLQERALKRKQTTALTRQIPAVADSERIQVMLLAIGEGLLALGLVTGAASQFQLDGRLIVIDHKTIFTLVAFTVIGVLLIAHAAFGLPGRRAARLVLAAYLLITLAFPGVKLVTDVILA